MRRPAFHFSLFFVAGVYAGFLDNGSRPLWLAFSILSLIGLLALRKENGRALAAILIFMAGGAWFSLAQHQFDEIGRLPAEAIQFHGTVSTVVQTAECAKLLVRTESHGDMLVSIYKEDPDYELTTGRTATFSGLPENPPTAGNPGGFDYRLYLRSIGVASVMQIRPDEIKFSSKPAKPLAHAIAVFRQDFYAHLWKQIGEEGTNLTMAMLFGDKSGLADDTYEAFQRNGTAHILSVSGLHVGFVYSIFVFLIGGKRRPAANAAIMGILLLYGVLSGFCPSVNRALLMIGLHMLSKVLCRQYDLLNSAGIAAVILLVQNPYALFHTGFQLSFFAILLMAWIFPYVVRILPKGHILHTLLPIPLLQTAMAPVTAFLFNYFSLGAYAANFGVVFLSGLLVPAGLLAMLFVRLPGPFFDMAATFMDLCIRSMMWCNESTYLDGRTSFDVTSPSMLALVLFYGLLLFFFSEYGRIQILRRRFHVVCLAVLLVIVSAGYVEFRTEDGFHQADLVFVDVGQGDCLHIRTPSGKNILIDGGGKESFDMGKKVLKPYLLKNGVRRIDLAVATHMDMDHYDGLRGLAACGMVRTMGLYEGNRLLETKILRETGLEEKQMRYFHQGDRIKVDDQVWLEFLYPKEKPIAAYQAEIEAKDENPRSLVIQVHVGKYRILMTGDIDTKIEEALLSDPKLQVIQGAQQLDTDILKIGHHGSKYSTSDEFLLAASPGTAVFQTGKNNYGHPDPGILEKCTEKGIMVYRTDKNGAIGFFGLYRDGTPTVRTIKEGK